MKNPTILFLATAVLTLYGCKKCSDANETRSLPSTLPTSSVVKVDPPDPAPPMPPEPSPVAGRNAPLCEQVDDPAGPHDNHLYDLYVFQLGLNHHFCDGTRTTVCDQQPYTDENSNQIVDAIMRITPRSDRLVIGVSGDGNGRSDDIVRAFARRNVAIKRVGTNTLGDNVALLYGQSFDVVRTSTLSMEGPWSAILTVELTAPYLPSKVEFDVFRLCFWDFTDQAKSNTECTVQMKDDGAFRIQERLRNNKGDTPRIALGDANMSVVWPSPLSTAECSGGPDDHGTFRNSQHLCSALLGLQEHGTRADASIDWITSRTNCVGSPESLATKDGQSDVVAILGENPDASKIRYEPTWVGYSGAAPQPAMQIGTLSHGAQAVRFMAKCAGKTDSCGGQCLPRYSDQNCGGGCKSCGANAKCGTDGQHFKCYPR